MSEDSSNSGGRRSRQLIRPLVAIVLVIAAYVASSLGGGLAIYLVYILVHGSRAGASHWLQSSIAGQFWYTVVAYAVFLAFTVLTFKLLRVSWRDISLGRPRWSDPLYALLALPAYYITYLVALGVVSWLVPEFNGSQSQQIGFNGASGPNQLLLVFVSLAVIPPLVEEIITRGYLLTTLKRGLPLWLAAILTSLVFALGHLEFGSGGPLVWVAALFTFILSLVLIGLRQLTGRLWAGIFLHALVNGISFIALFVAHSR